MLDHSILRHQSLLRSETQKSTTANSNFPNVTARNYQLLLHFHIITTACSVRVLTCTTNFEQASRASAPTCPKHGEGRHLYINLRGRSTRQRSDTPRSLTGSSVARQIKRRIHAPTRFQHEVAAPASRALKHMSFSTK